ncbi:hypothetical protein FRC02_006236 [Tulasnella sp. 418]|nr:hypothetical protein FRC02_006236 [Tulasnella sp. 418]
MSTFPAYFRHRTYGPRCASPPTFVCYELPQPEPYSRSATPSSDEYSDDDDERDDESSTESSNSELSSQDAKSNETPGDVVIVDKKAEDEANAEVATIAVDKVTIDDKTDLQPSADGSTTENAEDSEEERRRIEKREGKKKEEPVPEEKTEDAPATLVEKKRKDKKKSKRRHREESPAPPVRPILTIRSSQGFVWNQDLFVPPYIKERYIASSPPSSISAIHGTPPKSNFRNNNFFSTSNEMDYEVECVEIRVSEGEMDHIIPRYR